jgi:uncharacterized OB-fold protein
MTEIIILIVFVIVLLVGVVLFARKARRTSSKGPTALTGVVHPKDPDEAHKTCSTCGKQYVGDASFCTHCGSSL